MDKKSMSKLNRRRPPNLNLKFQPVHQPEPPDSHSHRENGDSNVIQPSVPVFASVHRPRHASISAIKRDNRSSPNVHQQQQQLHQTQSQGQLRELHQNQNHDLGHQDRSTCHPNGIHASIAIVSDAQGLGGLPEMRDNGNSNLLWKRDEAAPASAKGPSRSVDGTVVHSKEHWQGIHHHHNGHQFNYQQQHLPIAVAIPQPFHHQNQQTNGAATTVGVSNVGGVTGPSAGQPSAQGQTHPVGASTAHQLQPSTGAETRSRIPMSAAQQQNFNQISKTATNLLNDIYEKHLLSQTTFENASLLHQHPAKLPNGFVILPAINMAATTNASFAADGSQAVIPNGEQLKSLLQSQQRLHQHPQQQRTYQFQHAQSHANANGLNVVTSLMPGKNYPQRILVSSNNANHQQIPHNHHGHQLQSQHNQKADENAAMDASQHLYETVDPPNLPPPAPNRAPRKRIPGKILRKSSLAGSEEGRKQIAPALAARNQTFGGESHARGVHLPAVNHQPQTGSRQQQQQQQQLNSRPFYNPQPRTRADGENYPESTASNSSKQRNSTTSHSGKMLHLSQHSIVIHQPFILPPPPQFNTAQVHNPDVVSLECPTTNPNPVGTLATNNTETLAATATAAPINRHPSSLSSIRESCGAADGDISPSEFEEFERKGPRRSSSGDAMVGATIAKYHYRNSKIDLMYETAQAVAAAEYYAR